VSREQYSADEMMTVSAARALGDGDVCFVGIGMPSTAANLARLTHAPRIVLVYESGTIGAKPTVLPLSIGDGELAATANTVVSTAEIFKYWLQGGRIDVGFLGAAQIDRHANLNSTVIGPYAQPRVRLPGAGGAPDIAALARSVLVIIRQNPRTFVERLDFMTSAGFLGGRDARERAGFPGRGPAKVITDLCVLEPELGSRELAVKEIHPGVSRAELVAATGWPLRFAADVATGEPPSQRELEALRELSARTRNARVP
jgi:glutaconate CoA-transferase, subunit B